MAIAAVAILPVAAAGDADYAWQLGDWPYRVAATVAQAPQTNLPGDEIAAAAFHAVGKIAPDGRGIHVAVAGGPLTPHRVLQVGPGDLVRVAFALRSGAKRYYIYFGNAQARPSEPAGALEIRRGVLMETFAYAGGRVNTHDAARRVLANATKPLGADFRPSIFLGHNPFGPQTGVASRFTGYLKVPRNDRYTLIISSRNASFLSVDDKPAISNGGWHRPQRDYSKQAELDLTAGLHKIEMLHVSISASPVVVLAWLPDGRRRAQPVPESAFAPIVRAKVGPIEQRGRPVAADFTIRHLGRAHAGLTGEYYRLAFGERLVEQGVAAASLQWDFGDGQTGAGGLVEHVYLTGGVYRVKLTAQTPAGRLVRVHRVSVSRDWDRPRRPPDSAIAYGRIVRDYDLAALSDRAMAAAATLFEDLHEDPFVLDLGRLIAARSDADAAAQSKVLRAAARVFRRHGRADEAAALLKDAIAAGRNPLTVALLRALLGEVVLTDLNDPDGALAIFREVIASQAAEANFPVARTAWMGVGDAWRRKGEYAEALAAYRKAMPTFRSPTDEALRRGVWGRDTEAFIRDEQYDRAADSLRGWELQLPVDRLGGQTALLWARLHAAQRRWGRVVSVAEGLIKVNPDSAYAPQLLLQASDAYLKLGQPAAARGALRRIVGSYPESALAPKAREILGSGR